MKTGKLPGIKSLAVAAMLLLANQSHALYTNYLDNITNLLAQIAATNTDPKVAKAIAKAFKDVSKPSDSVAQDYNEFIAATIHLGALSFAPGIAEEGTNVFYAFINEAAAEIGAAGARVGALNKFVAVKKSASNQVALATQNLLSIPTYSNNFTRAIIALRLAFKQAEKANKLAARGEAHSGFALDSIEGGTLNFNVARGPTGFIHFDNATDFSRTTDVTNNDNGTYTYERTGLSKAHLVLTPASEPVLDIQLKYRTATNGTFTAKSDGKTRRGTFTLD